jgi:hypothetical protein
MEVTNESIAASPQDLGHWRHTEHSKFIKDWLYSK